MSMIFDNVNRIISDWNPIGVPSNVAIDEYKGYIPRIINSMNNRDELQKCLEDILINKLGLGYDGSNIEHVNDLQVVCDKILAL